MMMLFAGVLVLVAFVGGVAAGPSVQRFRPRLRKGAATNVNGGWLMVRARSTEHFCRPPDTHHETEDARGIRLYCLTPEDRWTTGDLWVCGCGTAWRMHANGAYDQHWVRSPEDDLP